MGIAFNGYVDPAAALSSSDPFLRQLPGDKIISLGGGNGEGHWTATALNSIINYLNSGKFDAYTGIAYDIEEGEPGLGTLFTAAYAATKARGLTCIVTVSHSAPYAFVDGAALMDLFFADKNIDYISPQLYSTGYETDNEYDLTLGVSWTSYAKSHAKIVPSIITASMYDHAKDYFLSQGVTCHGYIQWAQGDTVIPPRCGTSWNDAMNRCGTPCPSGSNSACPAGQMCFKDLKACTSDPSTAVPSAPAKSVRCGTSWADANGRCGSTCPGGSDSECPSGQRCFRDVSVTVCGSNANEATVVAESDQTTTSSSSHNGNEIPAWAIALIAFLSLLIVGIVAILVVLLKPTTYMERV